MRILMVHPHDIHSDLEPWTVRIVNLASELVELGHEVRLVHHGRPAPGGVVGAPGENDFPFEVFGFPRVKVGLLRRCRDMAGLAHWADLVHFQKCSHYASLPAICAAYYHGRPLHYDWDDWEQRIYELDDHSRIGSWIFFNQMEKHILKLVDTLSVASSGLKDLALRYGFPADRIYPSPVGADVGFFSPEADAVSLGKETDPGKYLVLYQGQISGANYVHLFIEAAKEVCTLRKDVNFMVVGGGDRLDDAKDHAAQLDLGDRVMFTGEVPHRDVPGYIAAADVVVACFEDNEQSRCKSPLKVAEYLASGKAIVASRVGEVPEMVQDAGLLVEPESHTAITASVLRLLEDDALRETLGEKARKRAVNALTWRHTALSLDRAYRKAMRVRYGLD